MFSLIKIKKRSKYDHYFFPVGSEVRSIMELFGDIDEHRYLGILNNMLEDYIANKILFFEIEYEYEYSISKYSTKPYFEDAFREFEMLLLSIELLEFVYVRKIDSKEIDLKEINLEEIDVYKVKGKFVGLFAVKSIIGYDQNLLSDFSIDFTKVKYLDSRKKISKCISFVFKEYNIKDLYLFQAGFSNLPVDNFYAHMHIMLHTDFKPLRFKFLDILPIHNLFHNLKEKQEVVVRYYNSRDIYSVKKKSALSIINMWNVYMLMNDLYYSINDKKIYKREKGKEAEYFSELDYLKINIYRIYEYLSYRYRSSFSGFAIENLISDYLVEAYKLLIEGGVYFLLPLLEKVEIKKLESTSANNYMQADEKEYGKYYSGYRDYYKNLQKEVEDKLLDKEGYYFRRMKSFCESGWDFSEDDAKERFLLENHLIHVLGVYY